MAPTISDRATVAALPTTPTKKTPSPPPRASEFGGGFDAGGGRSFAAFPRIVSLAFALGLACSVTILFDLTETVVPSAALRLARRFCETRLPWEVSVRSTAEGYQMVGWTVAWCFAFQGVARHIALLIVGRGSPKRGLAPRAAVKIVSIFFDCVAICGGLKELVAPEASLLEDPIYGFSSHSQVRPPPPPPTHTNPLPFAPSQAEYTHPPTTHQQQPEPTRQTGGAGVRSSRGSFAW